ncbi:hypothetical protein IRJ41_013865 [Triplophysa rosa]|uniref:Uncharacterized protein n=1 Tax=Triplophysa rosa TaxID=992332 RepID=A0A9W7WT62_TRIRA|nr:hypothetical protein IRJ41_013865 [Triplophysa rosa]
MNPRLLPLPCQSPFNMSDIFSKSNRHVRDSKMVMRKLIACFFPTSTDETRRPAAARFQSVKLMGSEYHLQWPVALFSGLPPIKRDVFSNHYPALEEEEEYSDRNAAWEIIKSKVGLPNGGSSTDTLEREIALSRKKNHCVTPDVFLKGFSPLVLTKEAQIEQDSSVCSHKASLFLRISTAFQVNAQKVGRVPCVKARRPKRGDLRLLSDSLSCQSPPLRQNSPPETDFCSPCSACSCA